METNQNIFSTSANYSGLKKKTKLFGKRIFQIKTIKVETKVMHFPIFVHTPIFLEFSTII